MSLTKGNVTAIAFAIIAIAPQVGEVASSGMAAFEGCRTLVMPVFTSGGLLLSAVIALFSKKITEPKK